MLVSYSNIIPSGLGQSMVPVAVIIPLQKVIGISLIFRKPIDILIELEIINGH